MEGQGEESQGEESQGEESQGEEGQGELRIIPEAIIVSHVIRDE